MLFGIPGAILVLAVVIVVAFVSVVGIMVLGSRDSDTHPVTASESHAVSFWAGLADNKAAPAQAAVASAPTAEPVAKVQASASGESTGQSVSDLSEDEKEAKRRAAMERKKAREASKGE